MDERNRSRKTRSEAHMPEPIIDRASGTSPEHEALLANTVGPEREHSPIA